MDRKEQLIRWRVWLIFLLLLSLISEIAAISPLENAFVRGRVSGKPSGKEPLRELKSANVDIFLLLRGGSDADEISLDSSSSSSVVMSKLRNIIRSVLEIGDRKVPVLSKPLRSVIKTLEGILGVELLPKAVAKKKKKNKKKSKKQEVKEQEEDEEDTEEAEAIKEKKPKKAKKPVGATAKHLNENLSTTNPNYRIQKELKSFIKDPPPNLSVKVGKNIRVWIVTMKGAKNTIYEGEVFKLRISFPPQYPTMPPSVYFLPPNIP
jgi:Ubiquitin-conjugating enzyme